MLSFPFLSSHHSTWYCFHSWSYNLVLANLQ
jgi:hypothetical protein